MITTNLHSFQYRNFQFKGNKPFTPQSMYSGERPSYKTDDDLKAEIVSNKAKKLINIGNWAKSIEASKKYLSVCEEKDYIHKASIIVNMAMAYSEMGQDDKALLCFYEATKFYSKIVFDYDEAVKNYRAPVHTPPKPVENYTEALAIYETRVGKLLMHKSIPQNVKKKIHKGDEPDYYFKKAYNRLEEIKDKMDERKYKETRNYCVKKIIDCCHKKMNNQNNKDVIKTIKKWANKLENQ